MTPDAVAFDQVACGALVMGCFLIGLYVLRFWRQPHDRLFAMFALAFCFIGIASVDENRVTRAIAGGTPRSPHGMVGRNTAIRAGVAADAPTPAQPLSRRSPA